MGRCMMECYNKPLSVDEIKALCDRDVMFKRALKCINELQSHSLQIQNDATRDANEMKGVCKCSGSSGSNYNVSVKINSETKRIIFTNCSCPYKQKFSKEGDLCKHVIALLLKHFCHDFCKEGKMTDLPAAIHFIPKPTGSSDSKHAEPKKCDSGKRKRNLPPWMKREDNKNNDASPGIKNKKSMIPGKQINVKRSQSKKRSYIKRTVYLMTPAELLETAREIINEESNTRVDSMKRAEETISLLADKEDYTGVLSGEKGQGEPSTQAAPEEDSSCNEIHVLHLCKNSPESKPNRLCGENVEEPCLRRLGHGKEDNDIVCIENDDYSILDELM